MYIMRWCCGIACCAASETTHPELVLHFSELGKLKSAAKQLLAAWKQGLEHDCTQGGISPRLNLGADAARNRAVATQAKWGAHKRDGGLYWATYKVCSAPCSAQQHPVWG